MSISRSNLLLLFRAFLCYCRTFLQSTGVTRRWVSSWLKLTDWSTCLQMHPATTRDRPKAASQETQYLYSAVTEWSHSIWDAQDINCCIWGDLDDTCWRAAPAHLPDVISDIQNLSCENQVQWMSDWIWVCVAPIELSEYETICSQYTALYQRTVTVNKHSYAILVYLCYFWSCSIVCLSSEMYAQRNLVQHKRIMIVFVINLLWKMVSTDFQFVCFFRGCSSCCFTRETCFETTILVWLCHTVIN